MKIPFFNYPSLYTLQKERIDKVINDVVSRGAYILQKDLEDFESALAQYCNVKYAIGVANGTDAIWLSLMAAGIGLGDEVIVPSHTYVASPASIKFVGASPVLVECGYDNMMDVTSIENAITKNTKAIMPVQLNGRTCNMDVIGDIAEKNNLVIIEDAAQGLGSLFNGKMAGTFGLAGTYSFYPAKVLGCYGDGGAVITNNKQIAEKIMLLRDHGRDENGEFKSWGFNSRLDNLQAAILLEKFKSFNEDIERRRTIAKIYNNEINVGNNVTLPPGPTDEGLYFDTYQNYELRAQKRDELKSYLSENGIGTIIQWGGKAIHQEPNLGLTHFNLPYTDKFFEECLMLPMNTSLTDDEALYITKKINSFYNE
ncbi:MAG: cell wall biogenesis protein [Dehalococcoidia bacterium]|nr:cell wall biogenesis protein [Dehalococcoidia bacterium]